MHGCGGVATLATVDIKSLLAPVGASLLLYSCSVCGTCTVAQEWLVLPMPTGPHSVGRTSFQWIDRNRPEVLSERSDAKREVAVWVWYPALPRQGSESAPYVDDLDVLAAALTSEELSLLSSVQTHSNDGAAISTDEGRVGRRFTEALSLLALARQHFA